MNHNRVALTPAFKKKIRAKLMEEGSLRAGSKKYGLSVSAVFRAVSPKEKWSSENAYKKLENILNGTVAYPVAEGNLDPLLLKDTVAAHIKNIRDEKRASFRLIGATLDVDEANVRRALYGDKLSTATLQKMYDGLSKLGALEAPVGTARARRTGTRASPPRTPVLPPMPENILNGTAAYSRLPFVIEHIGEMPTELELDLRELELITRIRKHLPK